MGTVGLNSVETCIGANPGGRAVIGHDLFNLASIDLRGRDRSAKGHGEELDCGQSASLMNRVNQRFQVLGGEL